MIEPARKDKYAMDSTLNSHLQRISMSFRIPFKVSFSANSTGDFRRRHALCFDNAVREHRGVTSMKK